MTSKLMPAIFGSHFDAQDAILNVGRSGRVADRAALDFGRDRGVGHGGVLRARQAVGEAQVSWGKAKKRGRRYPTGYMRRRGDVEGCSVVGEAERRC